MSSSEISLYLIRLSLIGLALFIPFSIAGANISIGLGILGWLVGLAPCQKIRERTRNIKKDPLLTAGLILVATALFSALASENVDRALRDWKSYWILVVYFLVGFQLESARLRKALFWVLFSSSTLSCAVALVQHAGGLDLFFLHIKREYRPGGTLYPMTFSGILYQVITLNLAMLFKEKRINLSALLLSLGICLQSTALLFTLTRGAWLALISGLLAVVIILKKRRVFAASTAGLAIVVFFVVANPTLNERASTIFENLSSPRDRNIATRLILWDISWNIFKEHPLFGIGMGDYSSEADKLLEGRTVTTTVDSHNIYLHVLATRGLFGFLPFVFFWVVMLRTIYRLEKAYRSKDAFERYLIVGALASTIAVLTGALTENNIDDSEVIIACLFIVGLAKSLRSSP